MSYKTSLDLYLKNSASIHYLILKTCHLIYSLNENHTLILEFEKLLHDTPKAK